jgi:WD40 repeat protein/tRNA A-37 threonylcarbamoyl transferase component Bud32
MSAARSCEQCGVALPPRAPAGLCPKCLLGQALRASAKSDRAGPETASGDSSAARLGDYELIERIATGGMGVVYKARQLSLNRIVALKMISPGRLAGEEQVLRFQAEAEAVASLQHPHIVAVHETGQWEGQHYFSMDYVAGQNLADAVRSQPMPPIRAAEILKAIAEAVHFAHQKRILHRDLKPSNIILDEAGEPHVTDFGLAKRLDHSPLAADHSPLTLTGQVLGSPGFMPPEQATGQPGTMDVRSDVYGLGAILYYVLTGRPPFQAATLTDTLKQLAEAEPIAPRLLNPSVPRDLATICLKCLEKDLSRRYPTAQALAQELGRFLRGEPILARPTGLAGKTVRWCQRNPRLATVTAAAVLSAILGLAGILWQWSLARAETLQARRNAYAADMNLAQAALEKLDVAGALAALNRQRPSPGQKDLRGWEWRYFWQRCREAGAKSASPSPVVLPLPVLSAALSLAPDSKHFIALDNRDGMASLWSILPLSQLEKLPSLGTDNTAIRWSPDGRTVAVGDQSGTVRIWNLATRRAITNFASAGKRVGTLKFYGRGRTLFCGLSFRDPSAPDSDGRGAKFWDTRTWAEVPLPPDFPSGRGRWTAVSADNRILAALDDQGTVVWWEMASGRRVKRIEHHFGSNDGYLAFSPVAPLLAGSTTDGVITIWEVTTGRIVTTIRANFKAVHGIAFSPDGQRLLSGGKDPSDVVRLLDLGSQRHVATLAGPPDSYWFLEMSNDLATLVASSMGGTALLWRAPSWAEIEATEKEQASR